MPQAPQSYTGVTAFPPLGLNRSGLACWFSIFNLIEEARKQGIKCYMWTLTFKQTYPDSWCGNMHRSLVRSIRDANRAGKLPDGFAGVRVTEDHPGGHGLHFHWIVRGRLPLNVVRHCAKRAGFGHVFIARDEHGRFRPVDAGAAGYVAKYLTKNTKLHGIRGWACIGDYEGTKTTDVEFDSESHRVFRAAYREAKLVGAPAPLAFSHAVVVQRRYQHQADDRDLPESLLRGASEGGGGQALSRLVSDRGHDARPGVVVGEAAGALAPRYLDGARRLGAETGGVVGQLGKHGQAFSRGRPTEKAPCPPGENPGLTDGFDVL